MIRRLNDYMKSLLQKGDVLVVSDLTRLSMNLRVKESIESQSKRPGLIRRVFKETIY